MKRPNPIDAVFKYKAKFDTQNHIAGTLLTQMQAGKLNQEKQIKKQLETTPSIKDLKIAEQLKGLRDFNRRTVEDDDNNNGDNDGNGPRPPRTPPPPPYDFPLYNTPLTSPPMSDDGIERTLAPREKVALQKKLNSLKISTSCFQKLMKFLIKMTNKNRRLMM